MTQEALEMERIKKHIEDQEVIITLQKKAIQEHEDFIHGLIDSLAKLIEIRSISDAERMTK
jgi:RecA/RadA recombinase